jgi:ABC-type Mn2+/Zn2+ transport system ATPase subunit
MPVITLARAVIGHPGAWQLGPVDLAVEQGSFWGIVGPNGAGKTTLLRSMAGLQPLVAGHCRLARGAEARGGVAYVPQRDALDPVFPVTALNVVMMGLAPSLGFGRPYRRGHRRQALAALERVGLPHLAQTPFRRLSGGEQQRTLIARAVVAQARVMLLDEPTAAMDVDAERDVLALIEELASTDRLAVLMVSHSLTTVRAHAHFAILVNRDQDLIRVGTPEEVRGASDPCAHESFRAEQNPAPVTPPTAPVVTGLPVAGAGPPAAVDGETP